MDNLPVCKRCCFCVPLRYGLLTWVYVKLIVAIHGLLFLLLLLLTNAGYLTVPVSIVLVLVILDIVSHFVFLVGGHKKNVKLLRLYNYYALVMYGFTILLTIVCIGFFIVIYNGDNVSLIVFLLLEIISNLASVIIQTYFLLLLRSEIIKLRSNCPYRYVKNATDSEGMVQYEGETADGEKGTEVYEKGTS